MIRAASTGRLPALHLELWLGLSRLHLVFLADALAGRWVIQDAGKLPGKVDKAIILDRFGNKWIGTNGGLAHLSFSGNWKSFTKNNTHGGLRN